MIMDILVGLILVGAMVHGLRKGFVHTFIHTIGWVLALVLAYIATPYVKRLIMGETTVYAWGMIVARAPGDATAADRLCPPPSPD